MSLFVFPAAASEKNYFDVSQSCYIAGGQVWATAEKESTYSEIIGSTQGVAGQICIKGFFGVRNCIAATLYNFRVACRDGIATAPDFYMALFGNEKSTRDNGFSVSGNQLSYIDPDMNGGHRVFYPPGYAPWIATQIVPHMKQLAWDDVNQRPVLNREVGADQERRIRELFVTRGGYVEPFPADNIRKAFAISLEKPAPSPSMTTAAQKADSADKGTSNANSNNPIANLNDWIKLGIGAIVLVVIKFAMRVIFGSEHERRPTFKDLIRNAIAALAALPVFYIFGLSAETTIWSLSLGFGFSISLTWAVSHDWS
jgi:hypothetical protein